MAPIFNGDSTIGVDLIRESAADLQARLTAGMLTSVELVRLSLKQIEKHDKNGLGLRAMISVASETKLLERAQILDDERRRKPLRSPLHGIPIIIKDIYDVHPDMGMPTTQGAWAMSKTMPKDDSYIVKKLQEAGLIILGKTNLSEFGAGKGKDGIGGLSGLGGQTLSVYVKGGLDPNDEPFGASNPGGSSTGSAVGVAAGYAPVSLVGEVDGSISTPASRSALFSLKCTPRTISTEGMCTTSPYFESPGGMAKTVQDLSNIIAVILTAARSTKPFAPSFKRKWTDFSIGFLDLKEWRLPRELFTSPKEYCQQVDRSYEQAISTMASLGAKIHYPITIPHPSTVNYEGVSALESLSTAELRESLNAYLDTTSSSDVHSLAEVIQYNKDHPDQQAGIGQEWLIEGQEDKTDKAWRDSIEAYIQKAASEEGILRTVDTHKLDFIVSCTDGPISSISALAGLPTANVPLGYLEPSGRPFGLTFVAKAGEEAKLIEIMKLYEASFPARRLPQVLVNESRL